MVGAERFELSTSCTPSKRASQATLRPDQRLPVRPGSGAYHTEIARRFNREDCGESGEVEANPPGPGSRGRGWLDFDLRTAKRFASFARYLAALRSQ